MPAVASVIAGATKPEQVVANVAAGAWEPSAEDLAALPRLEPERGCPRLRRVRIARFSLRDGVAFGVIEDDLVIRSSAIRLRRSSSPTSPWRLPDVRLLSPILPSKVVAIGKNYAVTCSRDGRRGAGDTADLPQAVDLGDRRRRRDPAAAVVGTRSTTKASWPSSSVGRAATCPEDALELRARLRPRQRRHGSRPAAQRRAVHPSQGLRLVLPARPVDRDRCSIRPTCTSSRA